MIRSKNRLFRTPLLGGGLGGDPPPSSSEMDWESGEEAKSTTPGAAPAPGGGLPAPSGDWAANPFGTSPAPSTPSGGNVSSGGGVTPPSGLTPAQLQEWINTAVSAGQQLSNAARAAAAAVGAVIPSSQPAAAPRYVLNLDAARRALQIQQAGGMRVVTPQPAANQNVAPSSDAGFTSGIGSSDIALIAGAAAAAGLGYWLLTRKKK